MGASEYLDVRGAKVAYVSVTKLVDNNGYATDGIDVVLQSSISPRDEQSWTSVQNSAGGSVYLNDTNPTVTVAMHYDDTTAPLLGALRLHLENADTNAHDVTLLVEVLLR